MVLGYKTLQTCSDDLRICCVTGIVKPFYLVSRALCKARTMAVQQCAQKLRRCFMQLPAVLWACIVSSLLALHLQCMYCGTSSDVVSTRWQDRLMLCALCKGSVGLPDCSTILASLQSAVSQHLLCLWCSDEAPRLSTGC